MKGLVLLLCASSAIAHSISLSTGDLTVEGNHAIYKLQMPVFELQHVPHPENALPDAIRLDGAKRTASHCFQDGSNYRCQMEWEYPVAPSSVVAVCWLGRITVLNHVHVLHARRGDQVDQAVFQGAAEEAELVFRREGPLLAGLRSRPSMVVMALFCALGLFYLRSGWLGFGAACAAFTLGTLRTAPLTPIFLEAAVALITSYAAFEVLFLRPSKHRWLLAMLMGASSGLYLAVLVGDFPSREFAGLGVLAASALCARFVNRNMRPLGFGLLASGLLWVGFLLR